MFNNEKKVQQPIIKFQTLIGAQCTIHGTIKGSDTIKVEGNIEGDIIWNDTVIIGETSLCNGNITCNTALISGKVKGNVTCQNTLSIKSTGHIEGDIIADKLIVDDGGIFEGNCSMNYEKEQVESIVSPLSLEEK
ncbi:bactofilin family protein [Hathewaya limosa]|uniref:Cytoskeletal protein CcmA (Bactofilin family) n=1 Tax=Hathewaya limosa TaxID=1536 RepID=A0ABU0JQE7_HATLI|nr:polymer-forming cytoskeletal protein [Hathewaya limosa]MDQ0479312.1 cytoskeletal protein CcmA (bactofilin family) [Hathewaya limosa]